MDSRYGSLVIGLSLFASHLLMAQGPGNPEQGFNANQAYSASPFDSINAQNGNLVINIPVISYPQRGKVPPFELHLVYNNKSWQTVKYTNTIPLRWQFSGNGVQLVYTPAYGWKAGLVNDEGASYRWSQVVDAYGSVHETGGSPIALDGSGLALAEGGIRDRSGTTYGEWGAVSDTSGNSITPRLNTASAGYQYLVGWTDTVGRQIPAPSTLSNVFEPGINQDVSPGCKTTSFPGLNGGTTPVTFCYSTYTASSNFQLPDITEGTAQFTAISSVTLVNGTSWVFSYNSWGDLQSVTFPTGAIATYQWQSVPSSTPSFSSGPYPPYERAILSRTVTPTPGSTVGMTSDTYTFNSDGTVTIKNLAQDYSVHSGLDVETEVKYYDHVAGLLKTVDTQYSPWQPNPGCGLDGNCTSIYMLPEKIITTLPSGMVSETCIIYDNNINTSCTGTDAFNPNGPTFQGYDGASHPVVYGSELYRYEYDFGKGAPGPLVRATQHVYEWQAAGSPYLAANVLDAECLTTTYGPGASVPQQTSCTPAPLQSNQVAQTVSGYDENNGSPQGALGNLTSVSRWLNTGPTTPAVTTTVYTPYGMPYQWKDANGNLKSVSSWQCSNLFPQQVILAYQSQTTVPEMTSSQYDCNTGKVLSTTDPNNVVTQYSYNDPLERLTLTKRALGTYAETWTSYTYPTMTQVNVAQDKVTKGDGILTSSTVYDGLGRTIHQTSPSGATIDTVYDPVGRVYSVSNPHFSTASPTDGATTYTYDGTGRTILQTQPDNNLLQWCYDGLKVSLLQTICGGRSSSATPASWVDSADETGRHWQKVSDALGRLTQVLEPSGGSTLSAVPTLETDYVYDALNNLTNVTQYGVSTETPRVRSFSYDSLSRLLTSYNPETGAVCYGPISARLVHTPELSGVSQNAVSGAICNSGYDANGNLTTRTDARGVVTTYSYDALNRLHTKTYSDGTPSVALNYDETGDWGAAGCGGTGFVQCNTKGRLSSMTTSNTTSVFGYDAMGRTTMKSTCIGSICGNNRIDQFFSYDLSGNETGYDHGTLAGGSNYFGGHGMTYDGAGRLQSLTYAPTAGSTPSTMFTATKFGPVGLLESKLGNGFGETRSYDVRLRQQSYDVVNASNTNAAASFTGVVDFWQNNDVSRFPNLSIPAASLPENGTLYLAGWVGTAPTCPVASVQIYIDQTPIGAAALGGSRPDVQQLAYNNDGQHLDCGYTFTGSIGATAPGTHTISAYATDASGNVWDIPMHTNALTVTSDPPPSGWIDVASTPIVAGGLLSVSGWGIDSQMHAPVGSVKILIDGVPLGYATLGISRPDVASGKGDPRYTNSGYSFTGGIGAVAPGQHTVSVIVYDSGGQSYPMTTSVTVVADTKSAQGYIDGATNPTNQTATISMDGTISAWGWAGETADTSACASDISRVDVLLDGNFLGQAQVRSFQRPDVATSTNNQSCLNTGWTFSGSVSNVDPGYHQLTVRAYDQTGGSTLLNNYVNIQVNAQLSPASVATTMPTQYAWSLGFEPNGNVGYSYDSVNGGYTYLYDSLNRLTDVNGLQWNYDSFGNRTAQVVTQGSGVNMYQTFSTNTNRPDGQAFDAAGNALNTGGAAPVGLTYDAEGRISAAGSTSYVYDAMGQRVAKYVSGSMTNAYLYDNAGHVVTELNGSFGVNRREVYAGSRHLATIDQSGNLTYVLADWLGSERARATSAGSLCQTTTSQPFGDNQQMAGTCFPSPAFFTAKERDTESGLDYFGARYYSSNMGRWMSPDPSNWGVDFYNPQTWNHYSYAGNNPLSNTDPNGLWLTPTHNSIIDNAFPGLSKEQRQILKTSSKQVDEDQSQEGSYKHGMSSEDNDPMSSTGAYNPTYQTDDFIEQNEHDAKEIQADWIASGHTGIAPAALAAFGNAAHTIADEYSPAHTGFQKVNHWTIGWHILRETTLFGMHKKQQQDAAGAIQSAFFDTFGADAGNQATHEKVTVTIIFDPNQKLPDQQQ